MPYYEVKWIEKHCRTVKARDEEQAMDIAREEEAESCNVSEIDSVEYAGPDDDEMDVAHAFQEDNL